MSRRHKEEERTERIIRGLLKQPDNRRCINCNSLGPQYVCTTFWTFICTNCSGIHREFTHRVKSVSMAKFNAEEVSALQAGGNERAKEIYFKNWDPLRNTLPDGCNLHRLRDFIKHVYVDRRYSGDKKLSMVRAGSREEDMKDRWSLESQKSNDERSERSLRYYMEETRSPQYRPESARVASHRSRSAANFEIVDDRFRDDAPAPVPRLLSRRFSNLESRTVTGLSPEPRKIRETANLPVVRNVKDDSNHDNVSTPKVAERPKENGDAHVSAHVQKPASNNTRRTIETKGAEHKLEKSSSSIGFSNDPQPPDKVAPPQTLRTASSTTVGNNSSVRSSPIQKASSVPTRTSLEALFELSVPSVVPSSTTPEAPNSSDAPLTSPVATSNSVRTPVTAPTTIREVGPTNGNSAEVASTLKNEPLIQSSSDNLVPKVSDARQLQMSQQHQPFSPAVNNGSTVQPSSSSGEHYNQPWNSSPSPDPQAPPQIATTEQSTQPASKLSQDSGSVDRSSKSSARKELPADLFTFSYPSYHAPVPSWQYHHPSQGIGYNMQYNPSSVPVNAFSNPARSRNPFDIGDDGDTRQVQAQMFPSMPSMQAGFPQVNTHMQPQSSPYPTAMSLGSYMGQQHPNSMPPSRSQGGSSFGSGTDAFGSLNPIIIQHTNNNSSSHTSPNSSFFTPQPPIRGNPFG